MINRDTAICITSQHYPNGPERLAEQLNVVVAASPLSGVEGWCVRGKNTIIRINSSSSIVRQRFTLAHELAHLVLGTEPDIATDPFRFNGQEERDADQLASEFLIPDCELTRQLRGQLPINARTLERLAKAANVSPVMAACRVVSATLELGLQNAAVVFFVRGKELWRYSQGLKFQKQDAEQLLQQTLANKPNPVRERNRDGKIVVGSIIDAQAHQVLLIQLLPEETAAQETREERMRTLGAIVFGDDQGFRQSVASILGMVKRKCQGMRLDEVVRFFTTNYLGTKYTANKEAQLRSTSGREYVQLFLERWFN